jgi:hypothetical protein
MKNGISWFARICSSRRQILVFVQRLAATFIPPNQLIAKILLCQAISGLLMVSTELRDAYQFCVNTAVMLSGML